MPLTRKQHRFMVEYLVDRNATQVALRILSNELLWRGLALAGFVTSVALCDEPSANTPSNPELGVDGWPKPRFSSNTIQPL